MKHFLKAESLVLSHSEDPISSGWQGIPGRVPGCSRDPGTFPSVCHVCLGAGVRGALSMYTQSMSSSLLLEFGTAVARKACLGPGFALGFESCFPPLLA